MAPLINPCTASAEMLIRRPSWAARITASAAQSMSTALTKTPRILRFPALRMLSPNVRCFDHELPAEFALPIVLICRGASDRLFINLQQTLVIRLCRVKSLEVIPAGVTHVIEHCG